MKSLRRVTGLLAGLIAFAIFFQSCGGSSHNISPLTITSAALPNGTAGTNYNQSIQASGGVGPYNWGVSVGALPHGLKLIPSSTSTATISGTPDTPVQADAFSVKISDSASQSATQPYTVSILALPDTLTLSPANLSFSPLLDGTTSGTQTATLTNTGNIPVFINNVAPTGSNVGDFTQTNTCASGLAAGANCTITVTFTPSQAGPRVASITITDDTAGSPHQLALNGIGLTSGANATLSASNLTFIGQAVGTTSQAHTITLTNYGTATLNVANIAATGDFAEANTCIATLASAASCSINVSFSPTTMGNLSGQLSVTDNITGSPQTVSLNGTGTTTKGTLNGICVGLNAVGTCASVQDLTACPVGTAAVTPVTNFCTGFSPQVDQSTLCQGTSRRGNITGRCEVN